MPLAAGTSLGHYTVTAPLGAGGMGEVYRARDTKLDRDVAIKVLPEDFAADAERLARFEREAKSLAALNHPNIATIHGFEQDGDTHFLVMELVEGEDLAERLRSGPMPVEEAIPLFVQIAEGLEAAHAKGVVHRDLKPANLKVTQDGRVKILDFGLAKAMEPVALEASPDLTQFPTMTAGATMRGEIMGTAAYMSPEQARGQTVDKRTDVWSFGAVCWEMLSGRSLFGAETAADSIAAILGRDVELDELPSAVPPALRRLLRRCLERNPVNRLHDIADARIVLSEMVGEQLLEEPEAAPVAAFAGRRLALLLVAVAALTIAAALLGVWLGGKGASTTQVPFRFSWDPQLEDGSTPLGELRSVRLSLDGRRLVVWRRGPSGLLTFDLRTGEERVLAGTEEAERPFLSPDGEWVGFFADGAMQKVPFLGGARDEICRAGNENGGAVWAEDDTIYFNSYWGSGLWRVAAEGGEPEEITELDPSNGETSHIWPSLLPESGDLLLTIYRGSGLGDAQMAVADARTGIVTILGEGAGARWSPSGEMVYLKHGEYKARSFDAKTGEWLGSERPTLASARPLSPVVRRENTFDIARDGTIAYLSGDVPFDVAQTRLAWVSRDGKVEELGFEGVHAQELILDPDGRRAAVARLVGGELQVWLYHLDGDGQVDQITREGQNYGPQDWHPDGSRISFSSQHSGAWEARSLRVDRTEPSTRFLGGLEDSAWSWSRPEGAHGIWSRWTERGTELWTMRVGDPESAGRLVDSEGEEENGRFSRDGRFFSYGSDGRFYVARYPSVENRQPVANGAEDVFWSPSTDELFFVRDGKVFVMAYEQVRGEIRLGSAEELTSVLKGTDIAVSPDAQRILVQLPVDGTSRRTEVRVASDGVDLIRGSGVSSQ